MLTNGIINLISKGVLLTTATITAMVLCCSAFAQLNQNPDNTYGWTMKIYKVDPTTYPFVNVYLRTFDGNQNPLRNVTFANVGLLVKGRPYAPTKRQYHVSTVRQNNVPVRTVFLMDSSVSMAGAPFEEALHATAAFISEKSENDQVAVVEMNDSKVGYNIVSGFTDDADILNSRLSSIQPITSKTRLYDTIGFALQLCRSASGEFNSREKISNFASCSLIVFSDGEDVGSVLTRSELISSINTQSIPIPINSLGYTKSDPFHLRNLQAISGVSFGKFFDASESLGELKGVVKNLQTIARDDIMVTFRSDVAVDGASHPFKVGIEYPAASGNIVYGSGSFEAIEPLPATKITEMVSKLDKLMPADNPYRENKNSQTTTGIKSEKTEEGAKNTSGEEKSFWQKLGDLF